MRLLTPRTPRVEKLERRGDARSLVRALEYRDMRSDREGRLVDHGAPLRAQAVAALARVDSTEAHDGLVRALGDSSDEVRLTAIEALRSRGGHGAVEPLADAAAGWTDIERAGAREAAVASLESLHDPDVPLRVGAAMIARGDELGAPDGAILRRLAEATRDGGVQLTVSYLLSVLGDATRGARAVPLLVALAPESVPPLMSTLSDPAKGEQAAIALGHIHAKEAVEPLCRLLLESEDSEHRRAAAWALGEVRDPVAVEALLLATSDRSYEVRAEANAAFDKFGNGGMALAISALLRPRLVAGAGGDPDAIDEGDVLAALGEEARAVAEQAVDAGPDPMRATGLAEIVTRELEDVRAELERERAELERERRAREEAEARVAAAEAAAAAAPAAAVEPVEPAAPFEPVAVEPPEAEPVAPVAVEPEAVEPEAVEAEPVAPVEPVAVEPVEPVDPVEPPEAEPAAAEPEPPTAPAVFPWQLAPEPAASATPPAAEPAPAEPAATEPATTEIAPAEPAATEPVVAEPAVPAGPAQPADPEPATAEPDPPAASPEPLASEPVTWTTFPRTEAPSAPAEVEPAPVEPDPPTALPPASDEQVTEPEPAPEPRATQHSAPTVPERATEATPTVEEPAPEPRATQHAASEPEPDDARGEPAMPSESLTSMDIDALAEFYDIAAEALRSATRIGREDKAERWRVLANAAVDEARERQRSGRWTDEGSTPRRGGLLRRRRNRLRDQLRMAMAERDGTAGC